MRARGLAGVQLCISMADEGLKGAIAKVLSCPCQRCTVHFLRDMLGHCSSAQQPMIATAIRQIFAAESGEEARERLAGVAKALERSAPKVARLAGSRRGGAARLHELPSRALDEKLRSPNPLERATVRSDGAQTSPASTRTTPPWSASPGPLLIEQNDAWLVGRRYLSEESLAAVLPRPTQEARGTGGGALPAA